MLSPTPTLTRTLSLHGAGLKKGINFALTLEGEQLTHREPSTEESFSSSRDIFVYLVGKQMGKMTE